MITDVRDCPDCKAYLTSQPHLIGACASVGISHNMSTREALIRYLVRYHAHGHQTEQPADAIDDAFKED